MGSFPHCHVVFNTAKVAKTAKKSNGKVGNVESGWDGDGQAQKTLDQFQGHEWHTAFLPCRKTYPIMALAARVLSLNSWW